MKPTDATNPLAAKAVLASLTVRHWTGRKLDRTVTGEVNTRYEAAPDAGRYNKELIPRAAFAAVYGCVNAARTAHRTLTLPWLDEGPRILPSALYDNFSTTLNTCREEFRVAADEFDASFPEFVKQAEPRLKTMFNAADYPEHERVRGMFSFNVTILPCPTVKDFRVSLAKEQLDDIRADMEDRLQSVLVGTQKELAGRITEVVGRMAERLKAYKPGDATKGIRAEGTFRESLVGNVRALVEILPALNLTNDPRLITLIKRMETDLCAEEPSTLREDGRVRKSVALAADEILKSAEALMA